MRAFCQAFCLATLEVWEHAVCVWALLLSYACAHGASIFFSMVHFHMFRNLYCTFTIDLSPFELLSFSTRCDPATDDHYCLHWHRTQSWRNACRRLAVFLTRWWQPLALFSATRIWMVPLWLQPSPCLQQQSSLAPSPMLTPSSCTMSGRQEDPRFLI